MLIFKAPFSGGALGRNEGCERAPDAIVRELESCYLPENSVSTSIEIRGLQLDASNIVKSHALVEEYVASLDCPFGMLGGDHSLTLPALKGFAARQKRPGLLLLDAHADCVNEFEPATHEDFLRMALKGGIIKAENIVLVGLRNPHKIEQEFLMQKGIRVFNMKRCAELGVLEFAPVVMELCRGFSGLYVSVDIDVADPAFAPGTGCPEPGGFSSRELITLVQKFTLLKNLIAWDIMEVNPVRDINGITVRLAARLARELSSGAKI